MFGRLEGNKKRAQYQFIIMANTKDFICKACGDSFRNAQAFGSHRNWCSDIEFSLSHVFQTQSKQNNTEGKRTIPLFNRQLNWRQKECILKAQNKQN